MSIKASSARQVDALLADLKADGVVTREGAIARLMIIGVRAVERLAALVDDESAPPVARVAALRALEGIGDDRALQVALRATHDASVDVATAAVALARTFLAGERGLAALDGLAAVVLDRNRPDALRESALRALRELDEGTVGPILETLLTDPSSRLRELARGDSAAQTAVPAPRGWLDGTGDGPLPEDPGVVRQALARHGSEVPLAKLHRVIERIRAQEQTATPALARLWLAARAAAHVALATRGSRLGVYDLREALDAAAEPLPVEFLAALTLVGDGSCLEPIAGAYARAQGQQADDWWPQHLADAFHAIVAREGVTRRHAVAKKIEKRWPATFRALWPGRTAAR